MNTIPNRSTPVHFHPFHSDEEAQEVVTNFSTEETYLRNLVAKVTLEREYALSLKYDELVESGNKIYNMARNCLEGKTQK